MSSLQVPPIGSTFAGRYHVEGLLGEGGVGLVLRATQLPNGRLVALKILSGEAASIDETVARFRREAQIASQIRNAHVVSVLDFGEADDGRQFIAMELLEGIDLANLIEQRGHLPTEEAVALTLQACAGVAAAHSQGLIHRDLKPANLFLARREGLPPVVKVLDFGLSKSLDKKAVHLTQTATAMGTPMYMAPEQIVSTKHVDQRCDQHAMAMVLFELLTGHPPYESPSATALAVAIATHPPPSVRSLRPNLPIALDEAIRKGLAKRPEDRFADLGVFAQAIVAFAPAGGHDFADMIETMLAPMRRHELEAAPTVQMSLPDWLLQSQGRRSGSRGKRRDSSGTDAVTPALPRAVERAAAVVTASAVSTDPRARVMRSGGRQTGLLLGGMAVGVALVGAISFAIVSQAQTSETVPPSTAAENGSSAMPDPVPVSSVPSAPALESARPAESAAPASSAGKAVVAVPSAREPGAVPSTYPRAPVQKPRNPRGSSPPSGKKSDPLLQYD